MLFFVEYCTLGFKRTPHFLLTCKTVNSVKLDRITKVRCDIEKFGEKLFV